MNGKSCLQGGQALAEAIVMLGVLAALMAAIHATGVWQDEALRTALSARQAAFAYTRFAPDPGYAADTNVEMAWFATLSSAAQPGGAYRHAVVLRQQWRLDEAGVASAQALMPMTHTPAAAGLLNVSRHTAVLRDAGHSSGDAQVQQRVASAMLGWQTAQTRSVSAGQSVASRMNLVDSAWARPLPHFDWLSDWTAMLPPEFLRDSAAQP